MATRQVAFPSFPYVFGILMIALGLGIFFLTPIGYQSFVAQRAAADWPQVQGVVADSKMLEEEADDIDSSDMYQAQVHTDYTVDGKAYRLNEIYVGQDGAWTSNFSSVSRLLKRYKKGRQVTVYFQPDKPSIATLEPGVKPWTYGTIIINTVFILMGLLSLGYAFKHTYLYIAQFFHDR